MLRLNQLQINILSGPVMRGLNVCVVLFSYPMYLRYLGFQRYGLWLVLSTVLVVSQLGNLGVVQAVAKVVAEEYARRDTLAIRQYVTTALVVLVGSGLGAFALIFTLRSQIIGLLGLPGSDIPLATELLPYCAVLSAYVFVADVQTSVLTGLGRIDLVNCLQVVTQVVAVGVGLVLLRRGGGVESLLAASMASKVLQHVLAAILTWRMLKAPLFALRRLSSARLLHLAQLCGSLFASTILNMLLTPFNRLVLARYVGIDAVPVYEIAYNGSMQVRSLFSAGSSALVPEISRLRAAITAQAQELIVKLNGDAIRLLLLLAGPFYLGICLLIQPLLHLWLHANVRAGQPTAFQIMLAGSFLSLLATVPYSSLLGLHRSRQVLNSHLVQSTVNITIIGAAILGWSGINLNTVLIATSLGMGASAIYLTVVNRQVLRALNADRSPEPARDGQELARYRELTEEL